MKPSVLIRADGDFSIGLGHLYRSIALAQMLGNDFSVILYCKAIPGKIKEELRRIQLDLIMLSDETDFLDLIDPNNIVVLDGYQFDSDYQEKIKEKGAKLVCIDDLHDKDFFADLIINHAPGIVPEDYKAKPSTQFALGPDYALLRPVFLKQARKNRLIEKSNRILISFGGSDYNNLTENTLKVVKAFAEFKEIIVITGSAYLHLDKLTELIKDDKRIEHFQSLNEKEMLSCMLNADLAIVPASGILFETLAAGLPALAGYYVDNQISIYKGFKNLNAIYDAEDFNSVGKVLNDLIKSKKIKSPAKVIDGYSGDRLVQRFKELLN